MKVFITGVLPISLQDATSGFNIARNVSEEKILSGLCGLSYEEVFEALQLPGMCLSDEDLKMHFNTIVYYYNGYHFVQSTEASTVFNTNSCLEYLQVSNQSR